MIIGEQKPVDEIYEMIRPFRHILILACGTCVTVSFAGGEKEAATLATKLRLKTKLLKEEKHFFESSAKRQCEWEFLDGVEKDIRAADAIVSLACGIGVQAIAEHFPQVNVFPGLNTSFLGLPVSAGVWEERCVACGDCVLQLYGGICPIARCAKSLLNGPCGGSVNGKCEISRDVPCAWQLIYDRLSSLGMVHRLEEIVSLRDWRTNSAAGPRKIVREDLRMAVTPVSATAQDKQDKK